MKKWLLTGMIFVLSAFAAEADAGSDGRNVKSPLITPDGGCYDLNHQIEVTIRSEKNAIILYTLDNTVPSRGNGFRVEGGHVSFMLPGGDVVIRAIAVIPGVGESAIRKALFIRSGDS